MKSILSILILGLFLSITGFAQEGTNKTSDKDNAKTGAGTAGSWNTEKESDFVKEAASSSLLEIQLGKLAQQKATSQEVKDFAQQMVKSHTTSTQKLKSVTETEVSSTLEQKHQQKIKALSEETGDDFDESYIDMMVQDHKDNIEKFEDAQENVSDPALKQWISSSLAEMKQHQQKVKSIQEKMNK